MQSDLVLNKHTVHLDLGWVRQLNRSRCLPPDLTTRVQALGPMLREERVRCDSCLQAYTHTRARACARTCFKCNLKYWTRKKYSKLGSGGVCFIILALRRQKQEVLCKFEARLVYRTNSRTSSKAT